MDHTHRQANARGNSQQFRILKKRGSERPEGIKKSQPVRKGERKQAFRRCHQPISENSSILGIETLLSPHKAINPAGQQVLQVFSSLPSSQGRQLKRKREEAFVEDLSGREPKASKPNVHSSSRSSAHSRERRDRKLGAELQQLLQTPSSSSSSSFDTDRKRRKTYLRDWKTESCSSLELQNPANKLDATSIPTNRYNPVETWIESGNWPTDFAIRGFDMADSKSSAKNSNKRPRTSSYSQSVKNELAPPAYTPLWEKWVFEKGLDMDELKGEKDVSKESQARCSELQKILVTAIKPFSSPEGSLRQILKRCQNRNEALVNRDVTPMLVPPITALYLDGANHLEHVVDEVNADWDERCVLAGPQLRPDLAIGLLASAFTSEEIDKLNNYTAIDNWTRFTTEMYFPFLMYEVKCGRDGLDTADRQNMHSCSVALRALLRIEEEADKYRLGKKLASLNGRTLVFSISHDQKNARRYGHYATIHGEKWTYHRYFIDSFNLFPKRDEILALHNYVHNILKTHLPTHVQRIKDALAAFPEPGVLSPAGTGMTSTDENVEKRDADGFLVPGPPASASRSEEAAAKRQNTILVQEMERQQKLSEEREERITQEAKDREERIKQESKEREESMRQDINAMRTQLDELMKFVANTKPP